MIRIIIVDDDNDAAMALKRNIDGREAIQVVAIYNNGRDVVSSYEDKQADIILMDVRMPHMDGIEASKLIKQANPATKILILTMFPEKDNMINAIRYNCDGFIYKGHKSDEIISIIKNTYKGLNTFEKEVQAVFHEHVFHAVINNSGSVPDNSNLSKLTEREQDIVRLITAGKKDNEIAKELFISEGHLRNKLVEIREKLGLRNSKELAVWGARMGL